MLYIYIYIVTCYTHIIHVCIMYIYIYIYVYAYIIICIVCYRIPRILLEGLRGYSFRHPSIRQIAEQLTTAQQHPTYEEQGI